jgi:hypothetical protein
VKRRFGVGWLNEEESQPACGSISKAVPLSPRRGFGTQRVGIICFYLLTERVAPVWQLPFCDVCVGFVTLMFGGGGLICVKQRFHGGSLRQVWVIRHPKEKFDPWHD